MSIWVSKVKTESRKIPKSITDPVRSQGLAQNRYRRINKFSHRCLICTGVDGRKQKFLNTITSRCWITVNAHFLIKDATEFRYVYRWVSVWTAGKNLQNRKVYLRTWTFLKMERILNVFKQKRIPKEGALLRALVFMEFYHTLFLFLFFFFTEIVI